MIDQIIKGLFLNLRHIRGHCDNILVSPAKTPFALQQAAQQILHVIKMGDNSIFHREYNLYVVRSFLKHLVCCFTFQFRQLSKTSFTHHEV